MPQASNITVKDDANVDTLFTLLTPAAGDGSTAVWQNKTGLSPVQFPKLLVSAKRNPSGVRSATVRFELPATYVDPTSGLPVLTSKPLIKVEAVIPEGYPEALRDKNVVLFKNLMANAILQAVLRDAAPAT